jgi:pimeloyl-ACP methyl ester carboxylesterase
VRLPALVVHGDADPLIDVSGGKATAEAIPDAELLVIPGMGHNLPRAVWPTLAEAIERVTGR